MDLTVFTVSGNVYQEFGITKYGKSKVVINIQEGNTTAVKLKKDTTDANGNYSIIIPNPGIWIITPELIETGTVSPREHSFSPASRTFNISQNLIDVDFEDLTTYDITGFVGGGCDKYLGQVDIRFFQDAADGTFDNTFSTDVSTGEFDFNLPARKYKVEIANNGAVVNLQLGYNRAAVEDQYKVFQMDADLTHADTSFNLYYRAVPTLELENLPSLPNCGQDTYLYPVLEQGMRYPNFNLKVWEGDPIVGCPLDTGYIDITDGIGGRGSGRLPISQGEVDFVLQGGTPNVDPATNYRLNTFISAKDFINSVGDDTTIVALVTGEKQKKSTFVTVSPEIPLYVLHDPPTDGGYSFLENGTVMQNTISNYVKTTDNVGAWAQVKLGFDVSLSYGVGAEVGYGVSAWIIGSGSYDASTVNGNTDEVTYQITTTERIQTSDVLIGDGADVFVGGAFNYIYGATDVIGFDNDVCKIDTSTSVYFEPDSLVTTFIKTTRGIENTIEELKFLQKSVSPDSSSYYDNQINVWEQSLANNRAMKQNLAMQTAPENLSIDGGVLYNRTYESSKDTSYAVEYGLEIDMALALEAGFEFAGLGASGGAYIGMRTETNSVFDTSVITSIETGYQLYDDDPDDKFTIDVHSDPQYNTPVFILKGALSSCPYEAPEFLGLDQFTFSFHSSTNPSPSDIDPAVGASYRLVLSNQGPETRTYRISIDDAYNPDGAQISIVGNAAGLDAVITLDSPDNTNPSNPTSTEIIVTVNKSPSVNVYSYRDLLIHVDPDCNPGVLPDLSRQTLSLSAAFRGDCSGIDITDPTDGRIVNIADNNMLSIRLQNYEKAKIDAVVLQYRKRGIGAWSSSADVMLTSSDLEIGPSGTSVIWNTTEVVQEGETEIRLLVTCTVPGTSITNINYSNIVDLYFDRLAPQIYGVPSPIDDIYDIAANDIIGVNYNEPIPICNNGITSASAILIDLVQGDTIQTTVTCDENTIKIVEQGVSLNNRNPSAYRVILSGVEDVSGNSADTYRWVFIVGAYDPEELACVADLEIVNNNENQDAINVSTYRALNITSNGQIPNFGTTSYTAQDDIVLNAGFTVSTGGVFNAAIGACDE